MSRIGALGEASMVEGFALAGAVVFPADEPSSVDAAWTTLPSDIEVLILTRRAADHLAARIDVRRQLLTVVMPV